MGHIRHGSASTTHAIRAHIQRSQASIAELSRELGVNPKTVAKWRKRQTVEDHKTGPQGRGERSTRSRRHRLRSSRREIQSRGSSAFSSLNRCEPGLPNSIPARGVMEGHVRRPDTRPIEDPAKTSKITLAKQGAS